MAGGQPPPAWAGESQLVKEHRVCIARCPCISIPIPPAHRPAELKADVDLRGRGTDQGCVFRLLMGRSVLC